MTDMEYCQIAHQDISEKICLRWQGQEGCAGCGAETRKKYCAVKKNWKALKKKWKNCWIALTKFWKIKKGQTINVCPFGYLFDFFNGHRLFKLESL